MVVSAAVVRAVISMFHMMPDTVPEDPPYEFQICKRRAQCFTGISQPLFEGILGLRRTAACVAESIGLEKIENFRTYPFFLQKTRNFFFLPFCKNLAKIWRQIGSGILHF